MDNFRRLEEMFCKFPGIGPRQAKRFVYYLLNKSPSAISEFTKLIEEAKKQTHECESCHRLFIGTNSLYGKTSDESICAICSDVSRDKTLFMVVARDSDLESVEKSGAYKGLYFILGGTIPILDKEPDKRVRLELLLKKVSSQIDLKEVILSLNTTPDGENTADIVKDALQKILGGRGVKISILGRGLSTGAELEYADSDTIKNALQNRK
jgi:recombination protein RecR